MEEQHLHWGSQNVVLASNDTVQCTYNSFIGLTPEDSQDQQDQFIQKTSRAAIFFGICHCFLCLYVLFYIGQALLRRHRLRFFQWLLLIQLLLLQTVEISYFFSYAFNLIDNDQDCQYEQKLYLASTYCLFYTISLFTAWQFQNFFRQVYEFVRNGHLPSDRSKIRNTICLTCIWLLGLAYWLSYTSVLTHYTNTQEFKFLWSFNFYSNVYVAVMLGCATFLFGFAYIRIKKLQKMLDNP